MKAGKEVEQSVGGVPLDHVRVLVRLSAALRSGGEPLRQAMVDARSLPAGYVEEAILQSYLFLGYPAALNGFGLWREVSGREAQPPVHQDPASWRERGEEVCRAVYGGSYPSLRENIRLLHPDMERWMVEEGYGKVLGRPGLPLPVRELCIVGLLAVQPAPRQLHSHLRGALNAGADVAAVEAALQSAARHQTAEMQAEGLDVWARVRARWQEGGAVVAGGDEP
jgi:4-carboxymuconolactone decarboxylase